ncbi:MAG: nuclear transport factor 2 family protein [Planctomycetaceae bacterium]
MQYGYDHFTLMKQKGSWKIVNLVFYGTSPEKN